MIESNKNFPTTFSQNDTPTVETRKYISTLGKGKIIKNKNVKICLFISVGKEHSEGEELRAQLRFLNENFIDSTVFVIIADKLQRFTYEIEGMETFLAEKKAIQNGIEWINQHKAFLKEELTSLKFEYIQWEKLTTKNDQYPELLALIEKKYDENEHFKRNYDITAYEFMAAKLSDKRIKNINTTNGIKHCLLYLKEENAVQLYLAKNGYDYACYSRNISCAIKVTYDELIGESFYYLYIKNKEDKKSLMTQREEKKEVSFKALSGTNANFIFSESFNKKNKKPSEAICNDNSLHAYMGCIKVILDNVQIDPSVKLDVIRELVNKSYFYETHSFTMNQ